MKEFGGSLLKFRKGSGFGKKKGGEMDKILPKKWVPGVGL